MTAAPCPMIARERGFSLVEAVISLAIIAVITLTLFATVTANARTRHMVRQRREALMVAQSQLDRAAGGLTDEQGQWGDLQWHIDRRNYGDSDAFAHNRLEQLTITVEDPLHAPLARLTTVRIAP
ncbi:type IV pilus modification PilV family protein [Novosphingobium sp.]|uniref:type IV pilus modification PilV family protein n=1 Tax=Novosphingobium sp. TaxID=1874826 RepID=UPI003B5194E7